MLEHEPELRPRSREALPGAQVERHAGPAPILDFQPEGRVGLRRGATSDAIHGPIAVVLAADVMPGVGVERRAEDVGEAVLHHRRVATRRRFHRRRADDLHHVVDHDVAQRTDRVVEMPAIGNAELLGQGDLHVLDEVPVPDRFEHRVGKAQVEGLLEPHLPEEVIDPIELRLVDVLVQLVCELPGRGEVVAEGLLDHEPGVLRESGGGQAADHWLEERWRDLEVENGMLERLDGIADLGERGGVGVVPAEIGEPGCEALEGRGVELLARGFDRFARVFPKLLHAPVASGNADDRHAQETALLEPVERAKRHHPGEVAGDTEDHEDVARRVGRGVRVVLRASVRRACRHCVSFVSLVDARRSRATATNFAR